MRASIGNVLLGVIIVASACAAPAETTDAPDGIAVQTLDSQGVVGVYGLTTADYFSMAAEAMDGEHALVAARDAEEIPFLATPEGPVRLELLDGLPEIDNFTRVIVHGILSVAPDGSRVLRATARDVSPIAGDPAVSSVSPTVTGNGERLLVIPIYFQTLTTGLPANTTIVDASNMTIDFYKKASYDTVDIGLARVVGPYTLPATFTMNGTTYNLNPTNCQPAVWGAAADAMLPKNGPSAVDITQYDRVVYVIPETGTSCTWLGWAPFAVLGSSNYNRAMVKLWVASSRLARSAVIMAHEIGHVFGLGHSQAGVSCTAFDGCASNTGRDLFDTMAPSGVVAPFHFNVGQKQNLGWPVKVATLASGTAAQGVYTLAPLEVQTTGYHALRIPRILANGQQDGHYVFEYRQSLNFDTDIDSLSGYPVTQGAIVHRVVPTSPQSQWVATTLLPLGTSSSPLALTDGAGIVINNGALQINQTAHDASGVILNVDAACQETTSRSVSNISETGATVSWASVTGAVSYDVFYRLATTTPWTSAGSTTTTAKPLTGLAPGNTFEWYVRTNCSTNRSLAVTPSSFATPGTSPCQEPSGQYTNNINTTYATANWESVPGALSYTVYYKRSSESTWKLNGTTTSLSSLMTGVALGGFVADAPYDWYVRTNCDGSVSTTVTPIGFRTLAEGGCGETNGRYTTNITTSSATLNWYGVQGAVSWDVFYRIKGTATWQSAGATIPATGENAYAPKLDRTGLSSGTTYEWYVRTNCSTSSSVNVNVATFATGGASVPGAPTGVAATAGNAQATVSWTAPASNGGSAITSYTVTSSPGGISVTTADGSTTSATISGLTNGTSYTLTVKATNAVGTGPASAASNAVKPATVPAAPTGVVGTRGNAQVSLTWTAPTSNGGSAITDYKVYTYTGTTLVKSELTGGTALSFTVTGLVNGKAYTFRVAALNALGEGALSIASSAVTPATVPGAPTKVAGTAGNAQVALTWTAPSNGGSAITGYKVYTYAGTTLVKAELTGSTSAAFTVTGVTNGTAYTFSVSALNALGEGALSAASGPVTPGTPAAPTGVVGTRGNAQVSLTWTAPTSNGGSAITDYKVYTYTGTTLVKSELTGGTALSFTVTGLVNGKAYTFRVAALNALGEGALSIASSAVTPATVPGAPTKVAGTAGNAQVALTWTAPSNGGSAITGYKVYTYAGTTLVKAELTGSTSAAFTVTGVTNGTAYTFSVSALNALGEGALSAASGPVTPGTPGA
jgi:hypothetical protein